MLRTRIAAAGSLVLLLAACTSPDTTANPDPDPAVPAIGSSSQTTPTSTVDATTDPITTDPGTTEPAPAASEVPPPEPADPPEPRAAGGPAECKAADLKLSFGGRGGAAAGTAYQGLVFTNASGTPCAIQGFPGVSYVAGDEGRQVGPAAVRVGQKGPAITLRPGAGVQAPIGFVQVMNFDESVCKPTPVRGLRIYPPHETASMFIPRDGTGCAGTPPGPQLTVQTVQPL